MLVCIVKINCCRFTVVDFAKFNRDLENKRSWVSSTNLSSEETAKNDKNDFGNVPSSWISTPDLANMQDDTQPVTTVSITLPKRKQKPIEAGQRTSKDFHMFYVWLQYKISIFTSKI